MEPVQSVRGIGKKYRQLLGKVIQQSNGYLNVNIVQKILNVSHPLAKLYLSRWAKSGWIKRIKRGSYIPLDVQTQDLSLVMEDPWVVAYGLFANCYIGGWTAAHHWGFTDQLYNDTIVLSNRRLSSVHQRIGNHLFIVRHVSPAKMFGTRTVWRERAKVKISDPHKTIVDVLNDPSIAGGIRSAMDFLTNYLLSPDKNLALIMDYAIKMGNKTIFKRLGYLLTILEEKDSHTISLCQANMSQGYSQLDPSLKGHSLVRKWRLWIPDYFHSQYTQPKGKIQ